MAAAAKSAPPPPAHASMRLAAQTPMVEMRASHKDTTLDTSLPASLWSVTSDGKVQRSKDDGKTYEQIHVTRGVKIRAIAALGNNIWTGGAGGALFHSVDGGTTWSRIGIKFEGSAVTETITGIQLHTPLHLTVTTASGSHWVSDDGGQEWQKQP